MILIMFQFLGKPDWSACLILNDKVYTCLLDEEEELSLKMMESLAIIMDKALNSDEARFYAIIDAMFMISNDDEFNKHIIEMNYYINVKREKDALIITSY